MSDPLERLKLGFEAWLEKDGMRIIDNRTARLLSAIQRTGKVTRAAEVCGISYAHVWDILGRIQSLLGEPVVRGERGGPMGGGGARLTPMAKRLMNVYSAHRRRIAPSVAIIPSAGEVFRRHGEPDLGVSADLIVIGSHCIGAEMLVDTLRSGRDGLEVEAIWTGSLAGVTAIMLGEADLSGIHLLDEETGEYNLPFLRKFGLQDQAVLIRGYRRSVGIVVAKGNPKRIGDIGDILRGDVILVNRNPGSGTRLLLDRMIRRLAEAKGQDYHQMVSKIRGYHGNVVWSHREVADMVENGRADLGLAISAALSGRRLEMIPVVKECYDFLVGRDRLKKPSVQAFIRLLRSRELRKRIERMAPGIETIKETGRILPEELFRAWG